MLKTSVLQTSVLNDVLAGERSIFIGIGKKLGLLITIICEMIQRSHFLFFRGPSDFRAQPAHTAMVIGWQWGRPDQQVGRQRDIGRQVGIDIGWQVEIYVGRQVEIQIQMQLGRQVERCRYVRLQLHRQVEIYWQVGSQVEILP